MFWTYFHKGWLNQSMNHEGACRTAPATPGLLNIHLNNWTRLQTGWVKKLEQKWDKSGFHILTCSSSNHAKTGWPTYWENSSQAGSENKFSPRKQYSFTGPKARRSWSWGGKSSEWQNRHFYNFLWAKVHTTSGDKIFLLTPLYHFKQSISILNIVKWSQIALGLSIDPAI